MFNKFENKFWEKVIPCLETDCWLWSGAKTPTGYGRIDRSLYAHRVSYELHFGKIPGEANVLHSCDNPSCVNPKHLFLGTHQDNMKDRNTKLRHSFGENRPSAKLNNELVKTIRQEITTSSCSKLAAKYGISYNQMYLILKRKSWKHVE